MERFEVRVTVREHPAERVVMLSPLLAERLGLPQQRPCPVRFGTRRVPGRLQGEPGLPDDQVALSASLAEALGVPAGTPLTVWREGTTTLACGPLIAYVTSRSVLRALRSGADDPAIAQMATAAREAGAVLLLADPRDILWDRSVVRAERVEVPASGAPCLASGIYPLPRVILYPTAVGTGPRPQELAPRARALGCTLLSHRKIRKLETYHVLQEVPAVRPLLAYTERLTSDSLARAMRRFDDLYLKPDDLSRGRGVHRLTRRRAGGWLLTHRDAQGNVERLLPDAGAVRAAVRPLLRGPRVYLLQEGLPLATFLGNRFDLRVLVQKNGMGRWTVSGMVARIAPLGSAITSPRSGGQVALPQQVLQHAFGERATAVLDSVAEATLAIARAIDAALGPVYELGIDLGVLQDGTVRLIEVNGMPLKVSLQRLGDPSAEQRIDRFPVHYAAWLDIGGSRP